MFYTGSYTGYNEAIVWTERDLDPTHIERHRVTVLGLN